MTDSEPSAIYSVLRGLDGVDEKTLKRPEVAYLSTVLEDGELPEWVLDGQLPDFVVATDRRIIHVSTSILGKIKDASYPYHEISRVEGALFMRALNIHTTNKMMPIQINAPKDRVEAFIAFVNPKVAEHRDPEPEIYSVLRRLKGVEEKTLTHPAVAYLPSVLEDGERPECVLATIIDFMVATDRRIVHVSKAVFGNKIKKHAFYPYPDILQIEYSSTLTIHTKERQIYIAADRDEVESFIAFVNPKIAEFRMLDIDEKALAHPAVAWPEPVAQSLWEGEVPLQITNGEYNRGGGFYIRKVSVLLVATDRRIFLVNKKFYKEFSYDSITSVESFKGPLNGGINIYVAGTKEELQFVPNDQAHVVADVIRNKVNELKRQSQAPSPPPPAPHPTPAPASVADELLKFSELLEKGLISQQEFDAQKAKLLGS